MAPHLPRSSVSRGSRGAGQCAAMQGQCTAMRDTCQFGGSMRGRRAAKLTGAATEMFSRNHAVENFAVGRDPLDGQRVLLGARGLTFGESTDSPGGVGVGSACAQPFCCRPSSFILAAHQQVVRNCSLVRTRTQKSWLTSFGLLRSFARGVPRLHGCTTLGQPSSRGPSGDSATAHRPHPMPCRSPAPRGSSAA